MIALVSSLHDLLDRFDAAGVVKGTLLKCIDTTDLSSAGGGRGRGLLLLLLPLGGIRGFLREWSACLKLRRRGHSAAACGGGPA